MDYREKIAALAEAHGTTYATLRPIVYAIERAVARGHSIRRYLAMLLDLEIITAEQSVEFTSFYRDEFARNLISAGATIARFHAIIFRGIDN